MTVGRLPEFWDPVSLIATVGGIGRLPQAPGTWASLAALPPAWLMSELAGPPLMLAAVLVLFGVGWWASERYVTVSGVQDPPSVVVDEVMAQWLTLSLVPADLLLYAAGFVLFRLFDIFKPWPASWADRTLKGGFGVMADDFLAGVYACLAVTAVALALGRF